MFIMYVVAFLIVIYLILKATIKIKYHFWSVQPVFHTYDIHHWLFPNRVIEYKLPEINKFVNIIDIKTVDYDSMSETDVDEFCDFIKENYLKYKGTDRRSIVEYFKSSNHKAYVSIYREPKTVSMLSRGNTGNSIIERPIRSVISARVLHITFGNKQSFPTYYIENLCVNVAMRGKGVALKAIQTFHYDLRRRNDKINTYLFRRECVKSAIVPLTVFLCEGYVVDNIEVLRLPHASMTVVEVTKNILNLFVEFMKTCRTFLECVVLPEVPNIMNLIESDNISIYGILQDGKLISVYVFRQSASINNNGPVVELVTSLSSCGNLNEIFYIGFTIALHKCSKEWNSKNVWIECLGDSCIITKYLKMRELKPYIESESAFFLYNYASYTIVPNKCFIFS